MNNRQKEIMLGKRNVPDEIKSKRKRYLTEVDLNKGWWQIDGPPLGHGEEMATNLRKPWLMHKETPVYIVVDDGEDGNEGENEEML